MVLGDSSVPLPRQQMTAEEIAALPSGLSEAQALLAERDSYRKALEYIVARGYTGAEWVAQKALKGEDWQ